MLEGLSLVLAQDPGGGIVGGIIALIMFVFWLAVIVAVIAGGWKMFEKAGQPGWGVLVPIYNLYLLCKIGGRPGWWVLLFLIPLVNILISIIVWNDISKSFGKDVLFTVGLVLLTPIFVCILGFGDARYLGPAADDHAVAAHGV